MKEDIEVQETQQDGYSLPKNKGGRPRKHIQKNRVSRESRVSLSGLRDKLTVHGKDPNYHYFWALDANENGAELYNLQLAGYEFVASHTVKVGQAYVYQARDIGTIVRIPNGDGRFMYLMRLPMQFYLDDQKELELKNKEQEQSIYAQQDADGVYGSIKLERK
jgi:hypothetical protein